MKKVIILTERTPVQTYFINRLVECIENCDNLSLEGVFLSGRRPYIKKIKNKLSKGNIVKGVSATIWNSIKTRILNRLTYPHSNIYLNKIHENLFGDQWKEITTNRIFFKDHHLISDWHPVIKKMQPDIIIAHGGGIVPTKIIKCAKDHTFNLHWGISPIYRGSFCTPFCILNNEISNIGVTIHELSLDIDGGAIYRNGRPDIEIDDTIYSIEMKLTKLGTQLITELLHGINSGSKPASTRQNLSEGNMYYVKDYTLGVAYKVNRLVRQGVINDYCVKNTK